MFIVHKYFMKLAWLNRHIYTFGIKHLFFSMDCCLTNELKMLKTSTHFRKYISCVSISLENIFSLYAFQFPSLFFECLLICFSNPLLLCKCSLWQSPIYKGHLLSSLLYMPNFILCNKSSPAPTCDRYEGSIRGWMYQCLMHFSIKN